LIQRRWRAIVAFVAAIAVLFAAPIAFLGVSINQTYVRTLVDAVRWRGEVGGFSPMLNRSIAGWAQMALHQPASSVVTIVFALLAFGLLVHYALPSESIELPFALAILVSVLMSPHALIHDLTLLLLPMAVALHYRQNGLRSLSVTLIGGYLAIIVGFPLSLAAPVQLAVLAMVALGLWLYVAPRAHRRALSPSLVPSASASSIHGDAATP
jgi:hypothetical protein